MQRILGGAELTDLHVDCYQKLVKSHFPHISGLQSTLYQNRTPLVNKEVSLQIIHCRSSHWAALEVRGNDVCLYDSAYTTPSSDTLEVIAQLIRSPSESFTVKVMNVAKQRGKSDYGFMPWHSSLP